MEYLFKEIEINSKQIERVLDKAFYFDEYNNRYERKSDYYPLFSKNDVLYVTGNISKIVSFVVNLSSLRYKYLSILKVRDKQIFEEFNAILKTIINYLNDKSTHFNKFKIAFEEFSRCHLQIARLINKNSEVRFTQNPEYKLLKMRLMFPIYEKVKTELQIRRQLIIFINKKMMNILGKSSKIVNRLKID